VPKPEKEVFQKGNKRVRKKEICKATRHSHDDPATQMEKEKKEAGEVLLIT